MTDGMGGPAPYSSPVPTPLSELLGIERPIVQAPMSAVPGLAAAVSNASALGMLALTWSDDAGDCVSETVALSDRPFGGNLILTRRIITVE
jgi:nitronate monooxygenase